MTSAVTIQRAREMWSAGMMRKAIAAETGLAPIQITRLCADLPKPIEHRGRKKIRRHSHDYDRFGPALGFELGEEDAW